MGIAHLTGPAVDYNRPPVAGDKHLLAAQLVLPRRQRQAAFSVPEQVTLTAG